MSNRRLAALRDETSFELAAKLTCNLEHGDNGKIKTYQADIDRAVYQEDAFEGSHLPLHQRVLQNRGGGAIHDSGCPPDGWSLPAEWEFPSRAWFRIESG
jgi:hypothetical protein